MENNLLRKKLQFKFMSNDQKNFLRFLRNEFWELKRKRKNCLIMDGNFEDIKWNSIKTYLNLNLKLNKKSV